jgi:hypothetical protein
MTRKHYREIAAIIASQVNEDGQIAVGDIFSQQARMVRLEVCGCIARDMIDLLKKDNPRFNANKFMEACGLP